MSSAGHSVLVVAAGLWGAAALVGLAATRWSGLISSHGLSGAAGVAAVAGGVIVAADGASNSLTLGGDPVGRFVVRAEPLASPFIALLGVIAIAIALYAPRYHRPHPATAVYLCTYNLALLASLVVLVSANAVVFLVAWESMALASYLLILRNHREDGVARAGFLFIAMSEAGFALIVAAFAILAVKTRTMDLSLVATRSHYLPAGGLPPCSSWRCSGSASKPGSCRSTSGSGCAPGRTRRRVRVPLPARHQPGHLRLRAVRLQPAPTGPAWWGLLTMGLGGLSAVLGILYALMERDIKRFLAYSSIENIGIILTALGAGLIFTSYHQHALGAFLLMAALYHTVNHGVYKTLLFLEAGVVEHTTGTRDWIGWGG